MKRILGNLAFCAAAALVLPACLLKETTEVWYVDSSGAATWVVTETDVRSDANNLTDRQREENEYWLAVQQQRHPIAAGLQELGGAKPQTRVLRSEAPYTVRTEARFSGLDQIGRRILNAIGALGESTTTQEGPTFEWTFSLRDPHSLGSVDEPSEGVTAVLADLDKLRVVLLTGRFESALGFTLSNDRRVATFDEKYAEGQDNAQVIALKLRWK